jgi:hypothetical protein
MKKFIVGQLNNDYFKLILTACVFFLFGCSKAEQRLSPQNIQYIKISYLPKGINPNMAIDECIDIFQYKPVLRDTILKDDKFLSSFTSLVNILNETDMAINYDFRISCLIFFKDESVPHRLCLGEDYLIVYNDVLMDDNKELFDLINETLYTAIPTAGAGL